MSNITKVKKTIEIQLVRPTEVDVVKYKVRKMAKSLLKHHCYCPILLMQTTKTAVGKGYFPSPLWVLIGVLDIFHT